MTQPPPPQPQDPQHRPPHQPPPPAPAGWSQAAQPTSQPGWALQTAGAPSQRRPNVFAIAGLVVAVLLLLTGPAQQLAFQVGISSGDGGASLGTIGGVFGILGLVLALITTALGVVGLVVPERGRILAAVVVGIGASRLVGSILGFATGALLSLG